MSTEPVKICQGCKRGFYPEISDRAMQELFHENKSPFEEDEAVYVMYDHVLKEQILDRYEPPELSRGIKNPFQYGIPVQKYCKNCVDIYTRSKNWKEFEGRVEHSKRLKRLMPPQHEEKSEGDSK